MMRNISERQGRSACMERVGMSTASATKKGRWATLTGAAAQLAPSTLHRTSLEDGGSQPPVPDTAVGASPYAGYVTR